MYNHPSMCWCNGVLRGARARPTGLGEVGRPHTCLRWTEATVYRPHEAIWSIQEKVVINPRQTHAGCLGGRSAGPTCQPLMFHLGVKAKCNCLTCLQLMPSFIPTLKYYKRSSSPHSQETFNWRRRRVP